MATDKVLLMILDGWGYGKRDHSDAIYSTPTPNIDRLTIENASSYLLTSGEKVGLPDGQMGNSEVGHLNIGAGRVVYQDLVKINLAVRDNSISKNKTILDAFKYANDNDKQLHFIGLVSDGGVHSSDSHLYKLCDLAKEQGLDKVFIHALTDGRDTDPKSGLEFMANLVNHLKSNSARIASITGRYYTMDRDKRWERIKIGYDALVHGIGDRHADPLDAIRKSYESGITDEFIKPIIISDDSSTPIATIQDGDVVICFNFRTDRLRQITTALTQKDFPEFGMNTIPLYYVTMTRYDDTFHDVNVIYDKDNVTMTLGEVISLNNLKQLRIAETEKYAHVTYFFSGGREETFDGEDRIMVNSPKVATYDLQPEMSAYEVKSKLIEALDSKKYDFICLNFANGDMVGHTGVYQAIQKAVKAVDDCVGQAVDTALKNDYKVIIIADHGNADNAVNEDGSPNTAHSLNPVPIIVIGSNAKAVRNGILADVAPTILSLMHIDKPQAMTGESLLVY